MYVFSPFGKGFNPGKIRVTHLNLGKNGFNLRTDFSTRGHCTKIELNQLIPNRMLIFEEMETS